MRRPVIWPEEIFEEYHYSVSTNNVNFANDIFVAAGKPYIAGQNWHVIVDPGVIIGSTLISTYCARTGIFPRVLKLSIYGQIIGKGGDGGNGGRNGDLKAGGTGGGGGGGAGCPPYSAAGSPGTDKFLSAAGPGTLFAGGIDGQGNIHVVGQLPSGNGAETDGGWGGVCMYLDVDTRIFVYEGGLLAAGGGGGGGGDPDGAQLPEATRRWGGKGGGPGKSGIQGGDGATERDSEGGAGGSAGNSVAAFFGPGVPTILQGRAYGTDYP